MYSVLRDLLTVWKLFCGGMYDCVFLYVAIQIHHEGLGKKVTHTSAQCRSPFSRFLSQNLFKHIDTPLPKPYRATTERDCLQNTLTVPGIQIADLLQRTGSSMAASEILIRDRGIWVRVMSDVESDNIEQ